MQSPRTSVWVVLLLFAWPASGQDWPPISTPYVDLLADQSVMSHGDLDGDGDADLVVAEPHAGLLYVAHGNGAGAFRPAVLVDAPGPTIRQTLMTDLDGDGLHDVAVLRWLGGQSPGEVVLFGGDGAGHLDFLSTHAVGWSPQALAAADLDGDGSVDLVTTCEEAAGISVLRGRGAGRFDRHVRHDAGLGPVGLALGDVTGDGDVDALVASDFFGTLRILQGEPGAEFAQPQEIETAALARTLALGDLDLDGDLDLVSGNAIGGAVVHENVGGQLVQQGQLDSAASQARVGVTDLNADALPDLVIRSAGLRTYLGDGALGFSPAGHHGDAPDGMSQLLGDFDGDGVVDVCAATPWNVSAVQILRGTGTGTLRSTLEEPQSEVVVADFDADGRLDMVSSSYGDDIIAFAGLPGGGFAPAVVSAGKGAWGWQVGDFDEDGHLDLLYASAVRSWLQRGDGALGFAPPKQVSSQCSVSGPRPRAGDVNGDGHLDFVTSCFYETAVRLGQGDGSFILGDVYDPPPPFSGASKSLAELLDLDGDGLLDILEVLSGQIASRKGAGDGTFAPPLSSMIPGGYHDAAAGDIDLDGFPDVVVPGAEPQTVVAMLNDGQGAFLQGATTPVGGVIEALWLADLDADGRMDLVAAEKSPTHLGYVRALRGNGAGSFGPPTSLPTTPNPKRLSTADLDGDGDLELIVLGDHTTIHDGLANAP